MKTRDAIEMVHVMRGGMVESAHRGHAVVCNGGGDIVAAWGDPGVRILPRSACKMIQALPLVESGAAARLDDRHLALACASHNGASLHSAMVQRWLADIGCGEGDLRCGAHPPLDTEARDALIRAGSALSAVHNNCSGKHAGFLTLAQHLHAGPEYLDIDHPVQRSVRAVFEETTDEPSLHWAIDGCSAPNFATSLAGLARAMARFAVAGRARDGRAVAMRRLAGAMMAHPELVAGEGRACTRLMRALNGQGAVKTGAEGVFVAILPGRGLGLALKIADGATRAAEAAVTALLVHLGALSGDDPVVAALRDAPIRNWRGLTTGGLAPAPGFPV